MQKNHQLHEDLTYTLSCIRNIELILERLNNEKYDHVSEKFFTKKEEELFRLRREIFNLQKITNYSLINNTTVPLTSHEQNIQYVANFVLDNKVDIILSMLSPCYNTEEVVKEKTIDDLRYDLEKKALNTLLEGFLSNELALTLVHTLGSDNASNS